MHRLCTHQPSLRSCALKPPLTANIRHSTPSSSERQRQTSFCTSFTPKTRLRLIISLTGCLKDMRCANSCRQEVHKPWWLDPLRKCLELHFNFMWGQSNNEPREHRSTCCKNDTEHNTHYRFQWNLPAPKWEAGEHTRGRKRARSVRMVKTTAESENASLSRWSAGCSATCPVSLCRLLMSPSPTSSLRPVLS